MLPVAWEEIQEAVRFVREGKKHFRMGRGEGRVGREKNWEESRCSGAPCWAEKSDMELFQFQQTGRNSLQSLTWGGEGWKEKNIPYLLQTEKCPGCDFRFIISNFLCKCQEIFL